MSTQIAGAQSDIEKRLAELNDAVAHGADGAAIAQARAQLTVLARLQRRITDVSPAGLASMRGEVTATVAATQAITLQGTPSGAQPYRTAQVALERASAAARLTTTNFVHAFYDEHEFDRYLKFASVQDEEEYRRREDERKQAIQKALDEHTPEGTLRAVQIAREQMHDAGAHGATASPEFEPTMKGLDDAEANLKKQIDVAKGTDKRTDQAISEAAPKDAGPLEGALSPEVMARLRATKIAVADQSKEGHGITVATPSSDALGRGGVT